MRKSNGALHYFINGVDQGIASSRTPQMFWGVVDLYGMAVKVSIVDRADPNFNIMVASNGSVTEVPEVPIQNGHTRTNNYVRDETTDEGQYADPGTSELRTCWLLGDMAITLKV